ncbi:hypothetical protein QFZ55_004452 [Streptomyces luteogriseus]|nr:hypothetical protein [Streptomyces luteogriseus]
MATLASLPVLVLAVAGDTDGVMVSPSTPVPNQYVPQLIPVPLIMATVGLRTWRLRAGGNVTYAAVDLPNLGDRILTNHLAPSSPTRQRRSPGSPTA